VVGPESVVAGERCEAVQRAPDDLRERVDVARRGERRQRLSQLGERLLERGGRVGLCEGELGEGEHGVVESRPRLRELEVGARKGEERWARRSRCVSGVAKRGGELGESLYGDGPDDRVLAGKVLYDHLTCPKEFRLFTKAEGAEGHCEGMASTVFWDAAYDWLDTLLTR
jgi:hypothetical protein